MCIKSLNVAICSSYLSNWAMSLPPTVARSKNQKELNSVKELEG